MSSSATALADAYDEAAYLILHTLSLPFDRLEPFLDARLTQAERAELLQIIERRVNERIPAAYLTHEAWLGEFRFYVDERVIIPRSFIAELLPDGLAPWIPDAAAVQSTLDLCTGSGCLAVLLAHHFPNADVDATDISPDALAVAQRNVADHGLQDRINLIRSDLLSNLTEKTYDLIISNPPYVTAMAMEELPPEYRHEPRDRARRRRRRPRCGAHRPRPRRRSSSLPTACWWSKSATTGPPPKRRFRACRSPGSPPAAARTACSCSGATSSSPRAGRAAAPGLYSPKNSRILRTRSEARVPVARARASAESDASVASLAACLAASVCDSAFGQFGPRLEDRLEARLVEPVAEHLGFGDDGRRARLAGQQSHFAEIAGRRQGGQPLPRRFGRLRRIAEDTDLAARENVERFGGLALARVTSPATNGAGFSSAASALRSSSVSGANNSSDTSSAIRVSRSRTASSARTSLAGFKKTSARVIGISMPSRASAANACTRTTESVSRSRLRSVSQ